MIEKYLNNTITRPRLEKRMLNGSLELEYNKPISGENFNINNNTAGLNDWYEDYSGQMFADLLPGQSYTVFVSLDDLSSFSSYPSEGKVFIDFKSPFEKFVIIDSYATLAPLRKSVFAASSNVSEFKVTSFFASGTS